MGKVLMGRFPLSVRSMSREFARRLDRKEPGEPFIWWDPTNDSLDVFIGDGECRYFILGDPVSLYVNTLVKPGGGDDPFVGFHISGGVQAFLQERVRKHVSILKFFVTDHNRHRRQFRASKLLEWWLEKYPPNERCNKPDQLVRIQRALVRQDPEIYIPL